MILEFKIFLYLSQKKYLISVFSELDHKCLFKNEYQILVPKIEVNEIELYDFLSQNIFNIENVFKNAFGEKLVEIFKKEYLPIKNQIFT